MTFKCLFFFPAATSMVTLNSLSVSYLQLFMSQISQETSPETTETVENAAVACPHQINVSMVVCLDA